MRAARALAPVRPTAWPAALGGLAVAIAALGAAFHTTWASITSVWWGSTTYHHGFLVAPISLWLAWQRRQDLAGHTPCQEPMALLPLAGFATLWLLGEAGDARILQHVGVVGMLASTVVALLGRPVCRALAFPLAFLFMVPFGISLSRPCRTSRPASPWRCCVWPACRCSTTAS